MAEKSVDMQFDPARQTHDQNYKLVSGLVVPRPVAWITSISDEGLVNLAPFSAYGMAGHRPPMLMVSIGTREGSVKDTCRNILANGEFVVNVAGVSDAANVQASSHEFPASESEIDRLELSLRPSSVVGVPRLGHVAAAMECRLRDIIRYADADNVILFADIVMFHVRDGLFSRGRIATADLDPLARVAGPNYAGLDYSKAAWS